MIAVDTNIIVRLMVKDDPVQFSAAEGLIASQPVFLLTTVLLETEWVLRKTYKNAPDKIAAALRAFVSLENVHSEELETVHKALDAYSGGMDFADALHLAQAAGNEGFATFDNSL